ncbi:MAG: winged helix-turn-helix domain-containing protein, partial [Panacagrimonas sp.]
MRSHLGRSTPLRLSFKDCVLDLERRELMRGGQPVSVGPQVFDVLVHLVQNHDRVVSRNDLLDAVWG